VAAHALETDTAYVDTARRQELIERYKHGPDVVAEAVAGITGAELDTRPGPEEWTAREVIHHLADSEMTSAIRLRQLLAQEDPVIVGYDEAEFARRLFYADRPIEASLEVVRAARRTSAEILERLTEEQWGRSGTHTESGSYGVRTWLEIYARHAHDHADQIRAARTAAHPS
jgi:hypothetical protein